MSNVLTRRNPLIDDVRRRLGLAEHDSDELLSELAALASWVITEADAGRTIDAEQVLARLGARRVNTLPTPTRLDDDEVERLAEILDRGFSPTPALRRLLQSLADPDYVPPSPSWSSSTG